MHPNRIPSIRHALVGGVVLAAALAGVAAAHDFSIVPVTFDVAAGHGDTSGGEVALSMRGALLQNRDSAEVARVVNAYHDAEKNADTTTVLSLLSEDLVVLEGGSVENKADFRAHHMAADIAFARSARIERGPLRIRVRGDAAWSTCTTTVQREAGGQTVTSTGLELMVLARENGAWRITAIHWSSRQRR